MLVTRDGWLWMSIGSGLARIRGREFGWLRVPIERLVVTSMVEEDDATLLVVAADQGLYRVDRHTGSVHHLAAPDGMPPGTPTKVWADRDGTIWVVVKGAWQAGPTPAAVSLTSNTVVYKPRNSTKFLPTGAHIGDVTAFFQAQDGAIWMAEISRSVRLFRGVDGRFTPPGAEIAVGAADLLFDRHGSLWIATLGDGLRRVADPRAFGTQRVEQWGKQAESFTEADGLSGDVVYKTIEDREGNIWFAGPNGIDRFRSGRLAEFTAKEGVRLNIEHATLAPGEHSGVHVQTFVLVGRVFHVDRDGQVVSEGMYRQSRRRSRHDGVHRRLRRRVDAARGDLPGAGRDAVGGQQSPLRAHVARLEVHPSRVEGWIAVHSIDHRSLRRWAVAGKR